MGKFQRVMGKLKQFIQHMPVLMIAVVFWGRIIPGYRTYQKILQSELPPNPKIYFMDYEGSGDTYLCCSYLDWKGKLTEESVFVASGAVSYKISQLFGFGKKIQITGKEAFAVRRMQRFCRETLWILPLLYESEPLIYSGVLRHMQGYRSLDFMSLLRVGFEQNLGIPYDEAAWQQKRFSCEKKRIDEIFRENRLTEGKTVLIAPYAGKHQSLGIPFSMFCSIAKKFQASGFTVCTNSSSEEEEPVIPGTIPLFLPYEEILPFCERAGYFVGVRSGLCDILSPAKMEKKMILYPQERMQEGFFNFMDFFSLKNMGLCDDALEISCEIEIQRHEK